MFPAGAGMNRYRSLFRLRVSYVPRRRGDEPESSLSILRVNHVPRRRGDEPLLDQLPDDDDACSPQARG